MQRVTHLEERDLKDINFLGDSANREHTRRQVEERAVKRPVEDFSVRLCITKH